MCVFYTYYTYLYNKILWKCKFSNYFEPEKWLIWKNNTDLKKKNILIENLHLNDEDAVEL